MARAPRGVQSLEIGGRILKALASSNEPMMLKDLAQSTGLGSAQCYTYLMSLCKTGLVQRDENAGQYRIGPFALRLGNGWLRSSALASATIAAMNSFSDETGLATSVAIWERSGPIGIHICAGSALNTLNLRQGAVFSITGSTIGRAFVAFGHIADTDERIEAELSGSIDQPSVGAPISRAEFEEKILEAREHGYTSAEGIYIRGINGISAPVYDQDGQLALVITMAGPSDKVSVTPDSAMVKKFLAVSKSVSHKHAANSFVTVA